MVETMNNEEITFVFTFGYLSLITYIYMTTNTKMSPITTDIKYIVVHLVLYEKNNNIYTINFRDVGQNYM